MLFRRIQEIEIQLLVVSAGAMYIVLLQLIFVSCRLVSRLSRKP